MERNSDEGRFATLTCHDMGRFLTLIHAKASANAFHDTSEYINDSATFTESDIIAGAAKALWFQWSETTT